MLTTFASAKPSPIKISQHDNYLYKKDGTLKEVYAGICPEFGLDPEEFTQKPLSAFQDPNVGYIVQVTRFNFYENRRQSRIQALKSAAARKYPQHFPQLTPAKRPQPPEESTPHLSGHKERRNSKVSRGGNILAAIDSRRNSDAEKTKAHIAAAHYESLNNTILTPRQKNNNNVSFDHHLLKDGHKAESEIQLNTFYTGIYHSRSTDKPGYQSPEDALKERLKKKAVELERHIQAKVKKENLYDVKTYSIANEWQKKSEKLSRSFDSQHKAREKKLKEKRAQENEIRERIEDIQRDREKARQQLELHQIQRMKQLEKKTEEHASLQRSIFEDKIRKFHLTQEKIFERKNREDNELVAEALLKIEQKLDKGVEIRQGLTRDRLRNLTAHSQRVNQLYEMKKLNEKQQSEGSFQELLSKLQKKSLVSKKAKRLNTSERDEKFEEAREKRIMEERKFQEKLRQLELKQQKNNEGLKNKQQNLAELIQARRELRALKAQEINRHLLDVSAENENKIAQTLIKHRGRGQKKKIMQEYLLLMNEKLNRHARLQEKFALQSRTPEIHTKSKTPEQLNADHTQQLNETAAY